MSYYSRNRGTTRTWLVSSGIEQCLLLLVTMRLIVCSGIRHVGRRIFAYLQKAEASGPLYIGPSLERIGDCKCCKILASYSSPLLPLWFIALNFVVVRCSGQNDVEEYDWWMEQKGLMMMFFWPAPPYVTCLFFSPGCEDLFLSSCCAVRQWAQWIRHACIKISHDALC